MGAAHPPIFFTEKLPYMDLIGFILDLYGMNRFNTQLWVLRGISYSGVGIV
jgi:hypothetical protein